MHGGNLQDSSRGSSSLRSTHPEPLAIAMHAIVMLAYFPPSEHNLCNIESQPAKEEAERASHVWAHAQAAKDYRTDADLHSACEPDAKQLCANVNPGQGRIQVCALPASHDACHCSHVLHRRCPPQMPFTVPPAKNFVLVRFITAVRSSIDSFALQSSRPFVWLLARGWNDELQT